MSKASLDLLTAFRQLSKKRIMVIGDLVLDTYTIGKAKRISPEAPVPVLHVHYEEFRPGMVGNVVLNLVSMGGEALILSRVGDDISGHRIISQLEEEGISTQGVFFQEGFSTPVKNRIIANHQQMVRVDYEQCLPLSSSLEQHIIDRLPTLLERVDVVAVSDYGKGFVTPKLLQALIYLARERNITTIIDPKGVDFARYKGAHVIKPNLSEVYAAANLPLEAPLEEAAERVLQTTQADWLMVTRSEEGIVVFYQEGKREDFSVISREVKDVTGAGDTVLAMLSLAMASGLSIADGARLSNVAAGIAIERFGCARVTLSDLAHSLLNRGTGNKVFDGRHLFALQEALKGKKHVILSLSSEQRLDGILFEAIQTLSSQKDCDLLICVENVEPFSDLIEGLISLHAVDHILVNSGDLKQVCTLLSPQEVFAFSSEKLQPVV